MIINMGLKMYLALSNFCLLIACSTFQRSADSGYSGNETAGSDRRSLFTLERSLSDEREKIQYYKNKRLLGDDATRTAFLKIKGYEKRQQWLIANRLVPKPENISDEFQEVIENHDIALGMSKELVRKSWGDPESIDVAGNPVYQNERWNYKAYVTDTSGYKKENRLVYFEGGYVVGWDSF